MSELLSILFFFHSKLPEEPSVQVSLSQGGFAPGELLLDSRQEFCRGALGSERDRTAACQWLECIKESPAESPGGVVCM